MGHPAGNDCLIRQGSASFLECLPQDVLVPGPSGFTNDSNALATQSLQAARSRDRCPLEQTLWPLQRSFHSGMASDIQASFLSCCTRTAANWCFKADCAQNTRSAWSGSETGVS